MITFEKLTEQLWWFSRKDGSVSPTIVQFLPGGSIKLYNSFNESYWAIDNGDIIFFDKQHKPTTRLSLVSTERTPIVFEGRFLGRAEQEIIHVLTPFISIDFSHSGNTRNIFKNYIDQYDWKIGKFTYGRPNILEPHLAKLEIGNFTSIANSATIVLGNHKLESFATYPFAAFRKFWPTYPASVSDHETKGDVCIGSDVWLGANCIILSGVKIGHGAVIGAHSVVTRSVPNFAIVAGNPAKIIRYRFDEKTVNSLMNTAWWDWPEEDLLRILPDLAHYTPQEFIERLKEAKKK